MPWRELYWHRNFFFDKVSHLKHPNVQSLPISGMRQMNGVLEFVDTADFTSMGGGEHFMCTDVEWDPTGLWLVEKFELVLSSSLQDDM